MLSSYRHTTGELSACPPIRPSARHARFTGPEGSYPPGTARNGHIAQNCADHWPGIRRQTGIPVSRPAPHGTGRLAHVFLGRIRNQSAGEVLQVDQGGKKATAQRVGAVGTNISCYGDRLAHHIGSSMISRLRALWNSVFRGKLLDRDLDEELQAI